MKTGGHRTTIAIVLAATGLVVAPVLIRGFPNEVARWHLADALNAVTQNDDAAAERSLQRATDWNPNVTEDINYWLLRVIQAAADGPQRQFEVLKDGVKLFPGFRRLGIQLADQQAEEGNFKSALEFAKYAHADDPPIHANELNQLAYYRALAGEDLDQALKEINQALEQSPKDPALMDTRAWVLFQMGKLTEALEDSNFAVNAMKEALDFWSQSKDAPGTNVTQKAQEILANGQKKTQDLKSAASLDKAKSTLTRRTAGSELWGLGALIYHRARILESLGRESEAAADYQWLKDRNLPPDNRLF